MKKTLFYLSVVGFGLSLFVHALSLADYDVTTVFKPIWLLHLGVFPLFMPLVFELRNNEAIRDYRSDWRNRMNPFGFFNIVLKDAPVWLRILVFVCFCYAIVNFFVFVHLPPGMIERVGELDVLQNHGKLLKVLTEQEAHHYKALETRGFSGHWMAFYAFAVAFYFPYSKVSS